MIVVITQVKIINSLILDGIKLWYKYLDEENCECRCMPGTFRCNSGSCLPMVNNSNFDFENIFIYLFRDIVVMVIDNVLMVVMN